VAERIDTASSGDFLNRKGGRVKSDQIYSLYRICCETVAKGHRPSRRFVDLEPIPRVLRWRLAHVLAVWQGKINA
jgi:hypothetical protein